MSILSFYRVELGRLLRAKMTWLIIALTLAAAAAPIVTGFEYSSSTQFMNFMGVANLSGGAGGGILFVLLTLYELSKMYEKHVDTIVEAVSDPARLYCARVLALLTAAVLAVALTVICLLPYGLVKLGYVFEAGFYFSSFALFMLCSILLSILLSAALYALTRRASVSFIIFLLLALTITISEKFSDEHLVKWLMPQIRFLSDDFGNSIMIWLYSYSRFIWFFIFGGLLVLSLLGIRRYGKGLLGSFRVNLKHAMLPVIAILLMGAGVYAYAHQPFYDNSPPIDYDTFYGTDEEEPTDLFLLGTELDIEIEAARGSLRGTAVNTVENRAGRPVLSAVAVNTGYTVEEILIDGLPVPFVDLQNDTHGKKEVEFTVPAADGAQTIAITYGGRYKMWTLLKGWGEGSEGIFPRYVSLGGSSLYPRIYVDMAEDIHTKGRLTLPEGLTPVTSGEINTILSTDDRAGTKTWSMDNEGASMVLEAADYVQRSLTAAGLNIEFYYNRKHEAVMEEIGAAELMEDVISFCTELYGPLPFSEDIPLKLIQSTAYGGGGYASFNLSVMNESIFSPENLGDLEIGASSQEVLAHEIIHQWWGLFAHCIDLEDTWWTDEGVTTFTTYLFVCDRYGEDYANQHYVEKWEAAVAGMLENFYYRNPQYLDILPEQYVAALEERDWGVQMYDMTALMIYNAGRLIGMDNVTEALSELYETASSNQTDVTFQDFLDKTGLDREEIAID